MSMGQNCRRFRMVTILDEDARLYVAIHPAWSIRAVAVITVWESTIARCGAPGHLHSDSRPIFIAYAIEDRLGKTSIKTRDITPASPGENVCIESFHDKLRGECLDRELFGSLLEAEVIIEMGTHEIWRIEYNESRSHISRLLPGASEVRAA